MENLDKMVRRLREKAYDQGYAIGKNGGRLNLADWEEEFWPDFKRGYNDGKAAE